MEGTVNRAARIKLAGRMSDLGVDEKDILEKFILGSGKGGQKVNKTASCVYLKHKTTGLEVKCGRTRYRELNRFIARRDLCDKIAERILGEKTRKQQEMEKIRRRKRRRTRRQKERILAGKRLQSAKKRLRSRFFEEE